MDIDSIAKAELLVRQANHALADAGMDITATQLAALDFIGKQLPGTCTLGDLAKALTVTPAVVTGLVDRLEKRGYVARIRSNGDYDRRVVYLQVTPSGHQVLRDAQQAFVEAAEEAQVAA